MEKRYVHLSLKERDIITVILSEESSLREFHPDTVVPPYPSEVIDQLHGVNRAGEAGNEGKESNEPQLKKLRLSRGRQ